MKRLAHSTAALIRVAQMSRVDIIVFVEGWTDRFFYDRVVKHSCDQPQVKYQIRTAKEIGAGADGKPQLISLFHAFKRRGALDGVTKARASVFFFLDKDVDELRGSLIKSRHIAYTDHYNVENYYFIAGDLPLAAASSAALEIDPLREYFGDLEEWRRSVANVWKEWVELCLYATLYGVACSCHFRSHSTIHNGCFGNVDQASYKNLLTELKQRSNLNTAQFKKRYDLVRTIVSRYYSDGNYNSVFNGKWYRVFAQAAVKTYAQGRAFRSNFARNICESLLLTIQFDDSWGNRLRRALNLLVMRITEQRQQGNDIRA